MTYNEFIDNILNTRGRFCCGEEYHERHHIKPKCLGGIDEENNLIDLFATEHFTAHKLLAQENPDCDEINYAYAAMAFVKNKSQDRYELTPKEYEEARVQFSNMLKERYKDKTKHPNYGKHLSKETREKIGKSNIGNKKCVGRKYSQETIDKMSASHKNISEETRLLMSQAQILRDLNGDRNPRAKKVIRLSDGKIYSCGKYAAIENNIKYTIFKNRIRKGIGDFMYYDNWLKQKQIEK